MKRALLWIFSIGIIAVSTLGFLYRQDLKDQYTARTYQAEGPVLEIGERLELAPRGSLLYRASQPELLASDAFNQACQRVRHRHSIVLGCYSAQRMYIYNVADSRLDGVEEVTAAHELLHAAYERLSSSEKSEVNRQLRVVAENINDERLQKTIEEYRASGEAHLENELHSILGTELAVLPDQLEQHYAKYFNNRQKIVSYAKQYEEAFESLNRQIDEYDQDLTRLKDAKDAQEQQAATLQQLIKDNRSELDQLSASSQIDAYNSLVPTYNQQIQRYNQIVEEIKRLVREYNGIVEQRNSVAASQNDLVNQLDSGYNTVQ